MSDIIQYDTSATVVGDMNIAEAVQEDKKIVFNESYTVAGKILSASSVYACYDLTVLGDLEVDDVEVRGSLLVLGDIKAKRLSCLKDITCNGKIAADWICGNDILAKDILCRKITCSGNIIARATIDVSEALEAEKAVITGEGILGTGQFSSKYAATTEYFDFQGDVIGKVVELETHEIFGEPREIAPSENLSFENVKTILKSQITEELTKAGEVDEDNLLEFIERLSEIDSDMLCDWRMLVGNVVEISYQDKITNLRDYLYVVMATKLLPEEIISYETIEHVFDQMLIEAEEHLEELEYSAKDDSDIAYSLKVADLCQNEIRMERDEVVDRIFQSIGIKYKTVRNFLERK
jgi:hypothetical protein